MTGNTLTLEIDSSEVDVNDITIDWTSDSSKMHRWSATLADISESVSRQDSIEIKRNGTSIFKGVLEEINPSYEGNNVIKKIGGRHTKVKLWRKWNERFEGPAGFWAGFYPHEIISFLLKRPTNDFPERGNTYRRIGWGMDSQGWTASGTSYEQSGTEETYHYNSALNKLDSNGWWLGDGSGQTTNDYYKINMQESKSDVCGIILRTDGLLSRADHGASFARNYKIETSVNDSDWTEVATKSNNFAPNILHSWTPASAKYIKIIITDDHEADWRIGEVYIYQSRGSITGISEGSISSHDPLCKSDLSDNASADDITLDVDDGSLFQFKDDCLLYDDNGEEMVKVDSVSGNTITLESKITGNYTTENNAALLNLDTMNGFNLKYDRLTSSIETIVKLLKNDDGTTWEWEVTDDGEVNVASSLGSDVSASISFTYGVNAISANKKDDDRDRVDAVLVLGAGKGDKQDANSSGWQGSGNYERVVIDRNVNTRQGAINRANEILNEQDAPTIAIIEVYDDYTSGDWGINDTITLTHSYADLSGTYRVKELKRKWSTSGEIVLITAEDTRGSILDILRNLDDDNRGEQTQNDILPSNLDYIGKKDGYIYFFEAENLPLDSDVTFVTGSPDYESNSKYICMADSKSGSVFWGPNVWLGAGQYTAHFRSQVSDNASSSSLVRLTVYSNDAGGVIESLDVKPEMYDSSSTWQVLTVTFELTDEVDDLEFTADLFQSGITNWYCDYVALVANGLVDFPSGPPAAPTNLAVTGEPVGIEVTWDKCEDYDFSYYILYRDTSSPATTEYARGPTNYFVDKNYVDYDTDYYYRVKAVDLIGNVSDYSNEDHDKPDQIGSDDASEITSDWLAVETRPWIHDLEFNYFSDETNDYENPVLDRIYWGKGGTWNEGANAGASQFDNDATVTFQRTDDADPETITINADTETDLSDGIHFFYWDEDEVDVGGKYNLQVASGVNNYSDAIGEGKGLIGAVFISADGAVEEIPSMLPINGYTPHIGAGVLNANSIISKYITATEWIEGNKLMTTGTTGEAGGEAGIQLSDDGLTAYSGDDTKTFEIDASSGYAIAYNTGSFLLKSDNPDYPDDPPVPEYITTGGINTTGYDLDLGNGTQYGVLFYANTDYIALLQSNAMWMAIDGVNGQVVFDADFDEVIPQTTGAVNLGSPTKKFGDIYGTVHYSDVYMDDMYCPRCGKKFKKGDRLIYVVKDIVNDDGIEEIVCIPEHLRCNPIDRIIKWIKEKIYR
jgi:hypothetical protein